MSYLVWLLSLSAAFVLVERLAPARRGQPVARRQVWVDAGYLLLNGHLFYLLFGGAIAAVAASTRAVLERLSLLPEGGLLDPLPFALQFVLYLVVSDFLQWCVHNLLHRVPFLWSFHKVHHSVQEMDWLANFRFHWVELVVYRSLLYVPLLWVGGAPAALFAVAVFATAWGHFNHANVSFRLGPLGRVFNSPRMHMWHHDASTEGGPAKNFGIVLSLWDYLFGTAYWPKDRAPERIGYAGDDEMPGNMLAQLAFPLTKREASPEASQP